MSDDADGAHELVDAATVHAARRDVVQAVAALAASPLNEQAADRMRAALARATSPTVQRAAGRITAPRKTAPVGGRAALVSLPAAEEPAGSHALAPVAGLGDVG